LLVEVRSANGREQLLLGGCYLATTGLMRPQGIPGKSVQAILTSMHWSVQDDIPLFELRSISPARMFTSMIKANCSCNHPKR
jgi:hypothetical protein